MKSGKLVDFFLRKKFWGVSGTLIHSFVARLRGAVEILCEIDRREDIERQTVSL